jgi:hypothetical protein
MSSLYGGGSPMGVTGKALQGGSSTKPMKYGVGPGMKPPTGYNQFQQFTPEQLQLFQSMFPLLGEGSDLARLAGGDESMFEQLEEPAMRQFQGLQGDLASRFSGQGLGGRRSSGFKNEANQQTSNFSSQLKSQRMGLQRQALQDLFGLSTTLMGQQPYGLSEKPRPWWQGMLTGAASGFGQGVGQATAGAFGG